MSETAQQNAPQFEIIRIYAKDSSLETPNSPAVFQKTWKPELKVEFDSKTAKINDTQYEVSLRITVTCNIEGSTAFICEVTQAGLFLARNLNAEALDYVLGATAPNILFPYAREFVANLVSRATFPQLNLVPINFEAVYRARKQQAQQAQNQAVAQNEVKS